MGIDCSSHIITIFEDRAPQVEDLKRMIGDRYSMGREGEGEGEAVVGRSGLHIRDHWSDRVSVSLIPIAANSFVRYLVQE